jgi:purine-binding chemotaxis protein CheW
MEPQQAPSAAPESDLILTLGVEAQACGVPVMLVREVLGPQVITPIPLSPQAVAGAMNLRGRIVTAVDLRRRLGLPQQSQGATPVSVVVEHGGELYALLADTVGEVTSLPIGARAPNPPTLDAAWSKVSLGVHRHGDKLLIVLGVAQALALGGEA